MSLQDFKNILQSSGIVGAGGAGFPSYAKLAEGADTLVLNCAECEPLIYTDYMLMSEHMPEILEGARLVMQHSGICRTVLALKAHRAELLGISDGEQLAEGVVARLLPDVYPMGDEIQLIYEATGRLVPPGALPITVGVIVYNAETACNIAAAVRSGTPVTQKWVTVGGAIDAPVVVRVPVGMRVRDLFQKLEITPPEDCILVDGGPSMGKPVNAATALITKTTKSLLFLPRECYAARDKSVALEDMLRRAASCCCACSRCTEMCPRNALGYPLEPHKMIRAANNAAITARPEMALNATLCCSCGVCAAVCCQDISPKDVILSLKGLLAKNKMRFAPEKGKVYAPTEDRKYHLIPSSRWESMLGVKKFDRVPTLLEEPITVSRVEITTAAHIGAPSVPAVKVGDAVQVGDTVATPGTGLSLPQHASIAGVVEQVSEKKIIIKAR